MAQTMIFQYRKQDTLLGRSNPLTKLAIIIASCIPLLHASLSYSLFILGTLLAISLVLRIPFSRFASQMFFFFVIALLIALTETGGWRASLAATLRFLDFILLSLVFADTTDPDDLARCLGPVLDVIPFINGYAIASTIELTLAMIPMVFEVSGQVTDAQSARLSPKRHPVRYLYLLTSGIFSNLLTTSDKFADALDARLFDPGRKQKGLGFHGADAILLGAGTLAIGLGWIW